MAGCLYYPHWNLSNAAFLGNILLLWGYDDIHCS